MSGNIYDPYSSLPVKLRSFVLNDERLFPDTENLFDHFSAGKMREILLHVFTFIGKQKSFDKTFEMSNGHKLFKIPNEPYVFSEFLSLLRKTEKGEEVVTEVRRDTAITKEKIGKRKNVWCVTADQCDSFTNIENGKYKVQVRAKINLFIKTNGSRLAEGEKVKKLLESRGHAELFTVAKEYLYCHKNRFFVVGVEVPLSQKRVKRISAYERGDDESVPLTCKQAKALALLAVNQLYLDLSEDNLRLTEDEQKIAIFDTEPIMELVKTKVFFNKYIRDLSLFNCQLSLYALGQLKSFCSDPKALKEVEKVEMQHVLWTMAKTVGKLALGCLVFSFIPMAVNFLPLNIASVPIQYALLTATAYKITELLCSTIYTLKVWNCSRWIKGSEENGEQEKITLEQLEKWKNEEWDRLSLAKISTSKIP